MIRTGALVLGALALALTACRPAPFGPALPSPPPAPRPVAPEGRRPAPEAACGGAPMTVRFYDAGQGLAALVTLPDGRHVLVDAGEDPARAACGDACATWHDRVMTGLRQDLGGAPIDLLWITHQHSDHLGGARAVTAAFPVLHYVDNGQSLDKALVKKTRAAAAVAHAELHVIGPGSVQVPLGEGEEVRLTAVVPKKWPHGCDDDPNDCSIPLRIDYCASSVLFTGDAEELEEKALAEAMTGEAPPAAEAGKVARKPGVGLLQIGHHGSDTSSSAAFISALRPQYAVISAAKRGEGTNRSFCHPRRSTIERLTQSMGGAGTRTVDAFDGAFSCRTESTSAHWAPAALSDRIWVTAIDGDVTLVTSGDGVFRRVRHAH